MQKVAYRSEVRDYHDYLDARMMDYIAEAQTETYEGFEDFDLIAFDWYDVQQEDAEASPVLIYIDREDLFFFCEDECTRRRMSGLLVPGQSNERALYLFFAGLLKNDMRRLEQLEDSVTAAEDEALTTSRKDYLDSIRTYRKELLRLKQYYDQLGAILDNLAANDNKLFTKQGVRYFQIVANRTERLRSNVLTLRDYVTQMREACQAQLDLEQNNLMRVFTVMTAVFLPLTLVVGWYGMNFRNMPELSWKYGYPAVIVLSAVLCAVLLIWFKRKKWF